MDTRGKHLLMEFRGCAPAIMDDLEAVQALMERAAHAAQASIVDSVFHAFSPQGVTGVVVVEESHFSIHTWPEHRYAALDVFTCGECRPMLALEVLRSGLGAESTEWMWIERGLAARDGDMKVIAHESDVHCDDKRSPKVARG